ncbi:hypothetical protein [Hymenobacter sp.]|uniref:hypothetical protein n=1 Tax=Hymenobacter sp. TaxID=1898978 RepID=UPI00286A176D|nr:hypothetical protein [Hymenobacter sp.]
MRSLPCLFLLCLLAGGSARAQQGPARPASAGPGGAKVPAQREVPEAASRRPASRPSVQVVDVYSLSNKRRDTLQLGDQAVLRVRGLRAALLYYQRAQDDLRLYVDGVPLPMKPTGLDTLLNADTATVRFVLLRDRSTESTWQLFYSVWRKLEHPAHIGIGFDTGQLGSAFPGGSSSIRLELVRRAELGWGLAAVAVLLGGLIYLARRSNLVRSDVLRGQLDTLGGAATALVGRGHETVPFSLSKVQLAFWTFLISSAYLLCYLVTGELTALPDSLLGLLGVSLGSNVFSRVLTREQIVAVGPLDVNAQSLGFWPDLLAEDNRFSIARIQFLPFNVLVGLYFVRHVWKQWSLPDLDGGLLALISISAAGFPVGKSQEHKSTAADAPPAAAPAAGTTAAAALISPAGAAAPGPAAG